MKVLDAAKDTYLMSNDEFLVVQGVKGFEELKDIENIPNEVRSLGDVEIVLDQMVWEDLAYETASRFFQFPSCPKSLCCPLLLYCPSLLKNMAVTYRRRIRSRQSAEWASLIGPALFSIRDKVLEPIDHVHFAAVCKKWLAVAKILRSGARHFPCS
ncbi:hypothetical protein ACFX13_041016 [Malus domestica]